MSRFNGFLFFFSSRRRHTRLQGDWSSDVCSSDLRHHPAIEGMRLFAHHLDHDGLAHFVRDHSAYHFLAPAHGLCICLRHYFFSVVPPAVARSRAIVFTRAMSLRSPRIFFKLSVCPILSWNFSLKS